MQIILDISDDLAQVLTALGQDPTRAALEAFVLEAYRQRRLSGYGLRTCSASRRGGICTLC